mmetsp:Transcript_6693/g.14632  ORF Transcript_6693/g.14632 Transcript_6693/m.14632 type:complete len:296 (-) Transcript_6693:127-1014(-)
MKEETRTPAEVEVADVASVGGVIAGAVDTIAAAQEGENEDQQQPREASTGKEQEGEREMAVADPEAAEAETEEPTAWVLVASARKTLSQSKRGIGHLKSALRRKIHLLEEEHVKEVQAGGLEEIILDGWVEELMRFLALKTLMDDATKPFQLAPGGAICIAWKELMLMPRSYAAVCHAMGNAHVIDHDPFDAVLTPEEERHMQKRLNATMRHYARYFDEQPPALFWKDVQEPQEPSPLVQIYRTAQQMWSGMTHCASDAAETVNGCTSTKQGAVVANVNHDLHEDQVPTKMTTAE